MDRSSLLRSPSSAARFFPLLIALDFSVREGGITEIDLVFKMEIGQQDYRESDVYLKKDYWLLL